MIPYPYNMVDMGGIDLAEANGTIVDGLYAKIVEAVNACGDVVLYNWKFAGIEIAPQHTSILLGDPIIINGAVQVTEQDLVTVSGINPDPMVLVPLNASENGDYSPVDYDADGFSGVSVEVIPALVPLNVVRNGDYSPVDYNADGFSKVSVEVPTTQIDKYVEVTPDYVGLSAGYITAGGDFYQWTAVTNYAEYATLEKGKYLACMGEPVGDRLRIALFPSKSFSDFESYISEAAVASTLVYNAETLITPSAGLTGDDLTRRFIFQATGGVCIIMTSSASNVSKPILLKIQEE